MENMIRRAIGLIPIVLFVVGCGPPPEAVDLLIGNVTVIDPYSRQVLPNHSRYVAAGTIRGLETAPRRAGLPPQTRSTDLGGS